MLCFTVGPLQVESAIPDETLNKLFTRTTGWIGADGNYSLALPNDVTLWFFSDTWIGETDNGKRKNARLINNSFGIATTDTTGERRVDFHWGGTAKKPAAWVIPDDGVGWFWPFASVFVNGRVSLMLMQMEKTRGSSVFGFRNIGVWLATFEVPEDRSKEWRIRQVKIPFTQLDDSQRIVFGSAMFARNGSVFIFGTLDRPKEKGFGRRMVVARAPAMTLDDFKSWRFFTGRDWCEDFKKVSDQGPQVAAEYSVMPYRDRYLLVTHEPMLGPRIVARSAGNPWGDWSEAVELYKCHEAKTKGVFTYSGKAHAALSNGNEILITYAANAFKLSDVINDATLYWPKFVRVKLK